MQLHGFSYASEKNYSAIVYLCISNSNNEIKVPILIVKSKIAPTKNHTIPRTLWFTFTSKVATFLFQRTLNSTIYVLTN